MDALEALARARAGERLELGTFTFAELDAVGYPQPRNYLPPSPAEVLAARSDLLSRDLAEPVEESVPLKPLGGVGLWQAMNAGTRSVLVCLTGLDPDESRPPAHDLLVSVLSDDAGPVVALTSESVPTGRAFGLATLPPVWQQVSDLVFAELGGPTHHSQLFYVRPTRKGGRDVIEARLERVTGAPTARVQELRTKKRFKIGQLSPETDPVRLMSWLDDLATTSW